MIENALAFIISLKTTVLVLTVPLFDALSCAVELLKNCRFNSAIGKSFFVAPKMHPYPKNSKILLQT